MNKTHKKILGFVGLGLVAAVTTVAAVMPAPLASAVGAVTDVITVRVTHNEPELTLTGAKDTETTSPNYSFKVGYNNVGNVKVTIVNKDDGGAVLYSGTLLDVDTGGVRGEQTFDLNLNDCGGYGNIEIKAVAIAEGGVEIERTLDHIKYIPEDSKADGEGDQDPVVPIPNLPFEQVTSITATLYDSTRSTMISIAGNPVSMDLEGDWVHLQWPGLADGTYELKVESKNSYGDIIKTEWHTILIDTDGTADILLDEPVEPQPREIGRAEITVQYPTELGGGEVLSAPVILYPPFPQTYNLHLPDNLPAGVYTITHKYFDTEGVLMNTVITTFIKSGLDGGIDVPVEPEVDTVTTIETNIYNDNGELVRVLKADRATGVMEVYDANGNLILTVPDGYKDGHLTIPMKGLPAGDYIGIIMFKNQYGRLVGNTRRIRIHWGGDGGIIVPDTGGLFQGLNISREDYLITGAVVFAIIGIVAFGVVKKNRTNKRK